MIAIQLEIWSSFSKIAPYPELSLERLLNLKLSESFLTVIFSNYLLLSSFHYGFTNKTIIKNAFFNSIILPSIVGDLLQYVLIAAKDCYFIELISIFCYQILDRDCCYYLLFICYILL